MSLIEQHFHSDALDPIDIVEDLAARRDWDFDRVAEDQIAMTVEGQWRTYSLTLAWSARDDTLRLISTFEMEPPELRIPALFELLNAANDHIWAGAFTFWAAQNLMVYRYGLVLGREQAAGADQIDRMIVAAVAASERFYPAFQLVCWADRDPEDAMKIAIAEAYGRA